MHRSGTSAVSHALALRGLQLPRTPMPPSPGNPQGHWGESEPIRWLHDDLFSEAGSSWDDPLPFPSDWFASPAAQAWRGRMAEAIAEEYPGDGPFVFKDPRVCLLMPFWLEVFADLQIEPAFVLPVRNPLEVAASLHERDGFDRAKSLLLWLRYNLDSERDTRDQSRAFVAYPELLRDWRAALEPVSAALGLGWPRSGHEADLEIERVLSAGERHQRVPDSELAARSDVVQWVTRTYACLLEACGTAGGPKERKLDKVRRALDRADLTYAPLVVAERLDARAQGERLEVDLRELEDKLIASEAARVSGEQRIAELGDRVAAAEAGAQALSAQRGELEAELTAARTRLDALEAERGAAEQQRKELEDQVVTLQAAGNEHAAVLQRMRSERDSQLARSRRREAELHAEIDRARRAYREARQRSLGYRLKTAWLFRRRRAGQRRRTASQLASWLLRPPSRRGVRMLREFLALRTSPHFDRAFYLRRNFDVANAGMNPVMHYIEHGAPAGLDPSTTFSTRDYLAKHPELADNQINPLYHFQRTVGREKPQRPEASAEARPAPRARLGDRGAAGDVHMGLSPRLDPEEIPAAELARARDALAATRPSVSVVVPTYNRAQQVRRALDSAFAQSYEPLEVIVSDDASTDGTEAVLRSEFAGEIERGRLRYLRGEEREGPSGARNRALAEARGDLVAYLDSDNAWHPDFLLMMAGALAEHDGAAAAYCGIAFHAGDDRPPQRRLFAYDRDQLLIRNQIDLNAFVHRHRLYRQLGGFDERLTRLVDWDLILRYTRRYPPVEVRHCLVEYDGSEDGGRVTHTADFETNAAIVRRRFAHERAYSGHSPLRIGYVLWDYPALSQTFVLNEIRELAERGYDVHVYYHAEPDRAAQVDFDVPTFRAQDADELAELLSSHGRTILHSHFAYPAVTRLAWPAARKAGVPFSFMVHAVDIFHRANTERNRIDEITADELCVRVFCYGRFHRDYLIGCGVPAEKTSMTRQAARLPGAAREEIEARLGRDRRVVASLARFVEKKGIADLVRAAPLLPDEVEVRLYGYGPLEDSLRALAVEVGGDAIRFMGPLETHDDVAAALREADVFALPCVVDGDGDMDGLPTVIGEAMAAGVPVVTTDVSAISEVVEDGRTGFIAKPRYPAGLAARITDVLSLEPAALREVIGQAQRVAGETWSVQRTVDDLLEVWERPPLDVVLVTHSRDEPDGATTTTEILERIFTLTTTPLNVTIVDNASDEGYLAAIQQAVAGRANAALVTLSRNLHWGPAMNVALAGSRSEEVVYVCSKEGFALRPGWERAYAESLRASRDVALAGHLISSPAFATGAAYARQAWFEGFRNKQFAHDNPDREFFHVQGGLFAIRRSAFERCGEFSTLVTQDAVDVEYSYYVESLGWKLGRVPQIPSVTKKTRPEIHAHLDEHTLAAHPLTLDSLPLAEKVVSGDTAYCNLCAWSGESFDHGRCPRCASAPFGRLAFRYLAATGLPYRELDCAAAVRDPALTEQLERMFSLTELAADGLNGALGSERDVVVADLSVMPDREAAIRAGAIAAALSGRGTAILGGLSRPAPGASDASGETEQALKRSGMTTEWFSPHSKAVQFDPRGLLVAELTPAHVDTAQPIHG